MHRVRKQIEVPYVESLEKCGFTAAVLDTGIGKHPDLDQRVVCFRDFVGNGRQPYDDNGHGTHVCGILCGSGEASHGVYRGIAPGLKLVVGKVLDAKGDGFADNMIRCLEWILDVEDRYRIKILNISVGIGSLEKGDKEKKLKELIGDIWDRGILVVCAAGNKGPGPGTICAVGGSSKALTVGCHDGNYDLGKSGRCENYSGRGEPGASVRKPDIVAPGTDIISCNIRCRRIRGMWHNAYVAKSGTSMATPIVSGAAALAFRKYGDMSNEECTQKLRFTATDLDLPWNQQGWGMVNVRRLLESD